MFSKIRQTALSPLASGICAIILGASVIVGWHTHNESLIQVIPTFAPMQYNTALGFLLLGGALVALIRSRFIITMICGSVVSLLGFLTLVQYIFHLQLGIDQLFMEHTIVTKTSHPGRMAPNTALCFFLYGLSFLFVKKHRTVMICIGVVVFVLASFSFLGYLIRVESVYGWGTLTRMAVHTALGFLILSAGLVSFIFFDEERENVNVWEAVPLVLPAIIVILTLFSCYGIRELTQARNSAYFETLVTEMESTLQKRYRLYEQSLLGGVSLFYASDKVTRNDWRTYAETLNIQSTLPGIGGIGYIDYIQEDELSTYLHNVRQDGLPDFLNHPITTHVDKFIIKYIEPQTLNTKALGLDIGFEKHRREAAEHARDSGTPTLTKIIELVQDDKKQPGFLLLMPVYDLKLVPPSKEDRRSRLLGWVYAPFIGANFMKGLSETKQNQLDFRVYDGDQLTPENLIYSTYTDSMKLASRAPYQMQTKVSFASRIWTIEWHSTSATNLPGNQSMGTIILIFGIAFAMLLNFTLSHLLRSKQTIARQVEIQTEKLADAFSELELVNKELEKFAYVASHDLKAPMRGIDNLAKWIAEDLENIMSADVREKINLLRQRIARLETLLDDILSYSRAGRIVDEPEEVNVGELVREVIESLSLPDRFNVTISDNFPILRTIRTPLQQVFLNLISNAHKHHDKKEGLITICCDEHDKYYEFSVQDDGPGIPEEFQSRVFEMFQTLQSRDKTEGTGLGMAIIKKLVEWQGGKVWIESKKGARGIAVRFLWPKNYKEIRMSNVK